MYCGIYDCVCYILYDYDFFNVCEEKNKKLYQTRRKNKLNIVIVGGHDCMHCRYKQICKKYGCKCKVFTQCPADFQNQIGSPEMIVVFTKTVAHKMLRCACKQAERTKTNCGNCWKI